MEIFLGFEGKMSSIFNFLSLGNFFLSQIADVFSYVKPSLNMQSCNSVLFLMAIPDLI